MTELEEHVENESKDVQMSTKESTESEIAEDEDIPAHKIVHKEKRINYAVRKWIRESSHSKGD